MLIFHNTNSNYLELGNSQRLDQARVEHCNYNVPHY
jgi:hypothetical protein